MDAQHSVPVLVGQLLEGSEDGETGVVAEHVDGTQLVVCPSSERLHGRSVGHVGPHRDAASADGLDLLDGRPGGVLVHVGHHHVHSNLGEGLRHRPAEQTAATGDHGGPALEVPHAEASKPSKRAGFTLTIVSSSFSAMPSAHSDSRNSWSPAAGRGTAVVHP